MAPLLPPSSDNVLMSWRRTLEGRTDPPIGAYLQSNVLLNCELVKTSQVQDAPIGTMLTGQASVTTTAAAISASSQPCIWVMLQAAKANTDAIRVGPSAGQYWEIEARGSVVIPIDDVAKIIADADSGIQALNWIAGVP